MGKKGKVNENCEAQRINPKKIQYIVKQNQMTECVVNGLQVCSFNIQSVSHSTAPIGRCWEIPP